MPTTERVVGDLRRQAAGAHLRSPADALRYLKADLAGEMSRRPRALNLEGAPAVITRLIDELRSFVGSQPQNDDITLIAIRKT